MSIDSLGSAEKFLNKCDRKLFLEEGYLVVTDITGRLTLMEFTNSSDGVNELFRYCNTLK